MRAGATDNVFSRVREPGFKLKDRLRAMAQALIEDALRETDGNQRKAAELLGENYTTLNRKAHALGIVPADGR